MLFTLRMHHWLGAPYSKASPTFTVTIDTSLYAKPISTLFETFLNYHYHSKMTTILPHLSVDTTRLCDGDDHVNCYFDLQGCNTTNSSIICDDAGGWSASLAFIGT